MSATIGDNRAPLTPPDELENRIELEHVELFDQAMALDAAGLKLPTEPATDEEADQLADHAVALRTLGGRIEKLRTEAGRPYLEGQRVINRVFGAYGETCDAGIKEMTRRVDVFRRAKEARERRDREIAEAAQRAIAAEQRAQAEAAADAAREAQEKAEAAAEALKRANTAEALAEAEAALRASEAQASEQRLEADRHAQEAAQAESAADANAHAASAPASGRLSAGGASTVGTKRWMHRIDDASKLLASLGPLANWLSNDAVSQALGAAVRDGVRDPPDGNAFPGVVIFQSNDTVIRGSRRPRS